MKKTMTMMKKQANDYYFYDTSSLLMDSNLFANGRPIALSSISLLELENIKTSANKDADIKYKARQLLHKLDEHRGEYDICIFNEKMLAPIKKKNLEITNDMKILACAIYYDNNVHPDETVFITNDVALKALANLFFGDDSIISIEEQHNDDYTGYKEIQMTDDEMANFYQSLDYNHYDLYINQYLLIKNEQNEIIDKYYWDGEQHKKVGYSSFDSYQIGKIKPVRGDAYQSIAMDSIQRNKITMIKGRAGTGKSLLSLGYLFYALEKGKIDKIVIFCNTVAVKNSAKLGFYPGTRLEKLLDSQIGNMLSSKLGSKEAIERLVQEDKLVLLPMADCRGYDTTGMRAGVYITEAQNLDIELIRLALQRIGDDCICILDGDFSHQVDMAEYAGANNGMRRVSQVFRDKDFYGEVELHTIYRSRIAEMAELL